MLGCDNAQLVSALNDEDQGTTNLITTLFKIPDFDLVNAAFGYQDIDVNSTVASLPEVGTGSNYGPAACLARCKALNSTSTTSATGPPAA